jgi:Tfp pilus assembly pilus retraction ATPase PilT
MFDIKLMLAEAIKQGASDVHINIEMPPIMRINTELVAMDMPEVTQEIACQMVLQMVGDEKFKTFERNRDLDFSAMIDDGSRFVSTRTGSGIPWRFPSALFPAGFPTLTICICPPSPRN